MGMGDYGDPGTAGGAFTNGFGCSLPNRCVPGGWLSGVLTLSAFLVWSEAVWHRVAGLRLNLQIGLSFAVSLLLIALPTLVVLIGAHPLPLEWVQYAALAQPDHTIEPWSLETAVTVGGTWFGFTAGVLLLHQQGGFDATGPWWQRGLRLVLGLIVVVLLWAGLGAIFPREATLLAGMLRYLRYNLIGLWIALVAPLIFRRVGLAGS